MPVDVVPHSGTRCQINLVPWFGPESLGYNGSMRTEQAHGPGLIEKACVGLFHEAIMLACIRAS